MITGFSLRSLVMSDILIQITIISAQQKQGTIRKRFIEYFGIFFVEACENDTKGL